ncbi:MAG: hypothetical protein JSR84_16475 [Proteobacteria bacterium]|nr:hypothetical protein [Pseudomonadota bacterium]
MSFEDEGRMANPIMLADRWAFVAPEAREQASLGTCWSLTDSDYLPPLEQLRLIAADLDGGPTE